MKLVPIALVALTASLSLLVGCSDGEKIEELEEAMKAQAEEVARLRGERAELKQQLATTGGGEMVAEEYANGQIKSRGYIKGKNIRTGEWTYWHENGKKKSQGHFGAHQKEGLWAVWDEFQSGKPWNGHWTYWHEKWMKSGEGGFKNGDLKGRWTYWHDNGQKEAEGEFKNGKQEGRWTQWKPDGSIDHEYSGIYKADKKIR